MKSSLIALMKLKDSDIAIFTIGYLKMVYVYCLSIFGYLWLNLAIILDTTLFGASEYFNIPATTWQYLGIVFMSLTGFGGLVAMWYRVRTEKRTIKEKELNIIILNKTIEKQDKELLIIDLTKTEGEHKARLAQLKVDTEEETLKREKFFSEYHIAEESVFKQRQFYLSIKQLMDEYAGMLPPEVLAKKKEIEKKYSNLFPNDAQS